MPLCVGKEAHSWMYNLQSLQFLVEQRKSPGLLLSVIDLGMELKVACVTCLRRFSGCWYASIVWVYPKTVLVLSVLGRWKAALICSTVFWWL